jgi:hypothetical protein
VSRGGRAEDATVSVRNKETLAEYSTNWGLATADLLSEAMPWRTFRWYRGQKHYSGTYWSSTEAAHVIYDSVVVVARVSVAMLNSPLVARKSPRSLAGIEVSSGATSSLVLGVAHAERLPVGDDDAGMVE